MKPVPFNDIVERPEIELSGRFIDEPLRLKIYTAAEIRAMPHRAAPEYGADPARVRLRVIADHKFRDHRRGKV